ncbi:MAG: VCBS repeat-containing protein [Ruminococcaceae bacterium]|nr:VCBS repeat-containing protein [Oscillospiraceae bacterium]
MMRYMIRIAAAAAMLLVLLTMSGCALSALTAENVMEPPQAFGDGAALQAALEEALGPQITLRYPRNGEYRSAVVRADVDNDEQEEAIVFYRQATESSGARMVLLDINEDGDWVLTGEFADAEGEIDRVVFGDINGDGTLDIITGWMAYSDYGTLYVHSCSDGTPVQLTISKANPGAYALSSYAEMAVGDFDADGADELLTVSMAGTDNAGEARLLKWVGGRITDGGWIREAGRLTLCSGTAAYTGSVAGKLNWSTYGLVVDSQRTDGSYCSELILWDRDSGKLVSPLTEDAQRLFRRTLSTESCDIDGDGYIEIPGDVLMPDCGSAGAQRMYQTSWHIYNSREYAREFSAIMRTDSGYYFTVPDRWQGQVTVQPEADTRTLRFCLANEKKPFSDELMSIRVFTMDEWDEEKSSDENNGLPQYVELCTTDYYVYAVRITTAPPGLNIDYGSVLESFHLQE